METLQSLSAAEQQMLVGLVVMVLVGVARAVLHWRGVAVSETAMSKLASYATVAGVSLIATLLAQGGYSAEFWIRWMIALGTAVGGWEGLSKVYNATIDRDALDAAAATARLLTKCLPVLLLCTLVTCTWCAGPAAAGDNISLSVAAALDDGATIGLCASMQVATVEAWDLPLYADVGIKREEASTDYWLGASTDACKLVDEIPLVREISPALDKVMPDGTCLGGGYLFRAAEWIVYLRTSLRF